MIKIRKIILIKSALINVCFQIMAVKIFNRKFQRYQCIYFKWWIIPTNNNSIVFINNHFPFEKQNIISLRQNDETTTESILPKTYWQNMICKNIINANTRHIT